MFSSASHHFTIISPSISTISYTVSNASPLSTPSSRVWSVLGHLCRILLCLFILAIDLAKLDSVSDLQLLPVDIVSFQNSLPGRFALSTANATDWRIVAAGSLVLIYLCLKKAYTGESTSDPCRQDCCSCGTEETLLVLRGLGVQTSTSSSTYLSTSTTRFIPTTQIQDIIIHEAFEGIEVKYYLAIIVEGANKVVVVFPVGQPPLHIRLLL